MAELAGKTALVYINTDFVLGPATTFPMTRVNDRLWRHDYMWYSVPKPIVQYRPDGGSYAQVDYSAVYLARVGANVFTYFAFPADYPTGGTAAMQLNTNLSRLSYFSDVTLVATCSDYTFSRGSVLHEVTPFNSDYKKRILADRYGSGTLSQWDVTDNFYRDALLTGTPVLIELRPEGTTDRTILFWALLDTTDLQAVVNDLQKQVVGFQTVGGFTLPGDIANVEF